MTTMQISHKTEIPAFIRHNKEAEKRHFQTMLILLGVDVAFVAISAIVGIPVSIILPVAAVFAVVISFFAYRASQYTKVLKKIDTEMKKQSEFYRFIHSI